MKSEWFKDWFNTPEYLSVYKDRNEKEAEKHINLILNNVDVFPGFNILDMACGTGRHAILLAKKGTNVTAVDLSENLISIAKQTAKKEKLVIDFIQSDIREFKSVIQFDLVLNLFTSFGYFETDEENFSILQKAYDFLVPDGYFVLDFFNSEFLQKNLVEFSEETLDDSVIHQYRKIKDKRIIKKIAITKSGDTNEFEESVRMFTKDELVNELTKIGFDIYKTYGDFLGNEFEQFVSPRLILICKK
ncbi:MAG: class I SAM-dependent methyltransferase [Ignavibacteriaceae bacterium]|nr:class I SAM-dependent methyltransferase [Ignavibacterium sp.]MCC6254268.1 class I SAM-dependent methyltransferase [Ignavibacteriaceae bacterium]HMN24484.1 class I SAM-dependent methyltransferase [Ignavibacteriaceae bacterium]HRN27666.1 class I SAM-dependent methyltransferase [Ignavibacteriaceae bacterium]HRP94075.1 class I SAM-dependent methyltransferase [Ignavibacteriaceae bacterium]